jgi:AcrR family transcriptional regulator
MTLSTRQEEIINAAIKLIAEKSIQALTIKNLSKQIGFTEGAVYRHFSSKLDILLHILLKFQSNAKEMLESACSTDLPAMNQIEEIFMHNISSFVENPAIAAVIFSESIFQNEERLSREVFKLLEMHEKTLACIIKRGQEKGELIRGIHKEEIIRIIIGSVRYTVTKWRLGHYQFNLEEEGKALIDAIRHLITVK